MSEVTQLPKGSDAGVLILVPGSAGFNSLLKLLTGETVSGIDAAFNTFVTAMAIA